MYISKHFGDDEFRCHCCGKLPEKGMDAKLLQLLDDMRDAVKQPLIINCGFRCPKHNAEVGGVADSQHLTGQAADVDATEIGVVILADLADKLLADGVGRYPNDKFVHVDVRTGRTGAGYRW